MSNLLLNKTTQSWINAYINRPAATLLIDSTDDTANGILVGEHIYSELIDSKSSPLIRVKIADTKSIGIEQVRSLHKTLSLSANKSQGISRIALIEQAELLTPQAQNALLKLIEELPKRTLLFLVCSNKENLLPTIVSRCFLIPVLPLEKSTAQNYARVNDISDVEAEKAYMLSEGRATSFVDIILGKDNKVTEQTDLAKDFLKKSIFDRQSIVKSMTTGDVDALTFVSSIKIVAKIGLKNAQGIQQKNRWRKTLQSAVEAENQLNSNLSAKLVLLNLSMRV